MTNAEFQSILSAMHPIGIATIVVAGVFLGGGREVAIVVGVAIASIVRKAKGKPSLGSDCAGCSHAGQCNGHCCNQDQKVDWSELVAKRKEELRQQEAENRHCDDDNAQ